MKKLFTCAFVAFVFLSACDDKDNTTVNDYEINAESSFVAWRGYTPDINNHGTISIKKDIITTDNKVVTGGTFSMPLSSINVLNLEGELKALLTQHLQSADFFNAVLHPNITFEIKQIVPHQGNEMEGIISGANYRVTGDLTFLGQSHSVSFPAKIDVSDKDLGVAALVKIDRLKWGMDYESDPTSENYILPSIELEVKLVANRR